ncbi:hypothetical protein [Dinoroseobacter sp. S375]|uniref:hypothetical protein n=1 Tax=Dinoroseobacter sp. S375 TaxID=3415136 RepID=UPI003C7CDE13
MTDRRKLGTLVLGIGFAATSSKAANIVDITASEFANVMIAEIETDSGVIPVIGTVLHPGLRPASR